MNDFFTMVRAAYNAYATSGARSTAKIQILHGYLAHRLAKMVPSDIQIHSQGYGDNKESRIQGAFNQKNCDITLIREKAGEAPSPLATIPVKFPITNFKQNANNYFENMCGETANLQIAGVKTFHFILLPLWMPYLSSNHTITKIERITNADIDKYRKLAQIEQSKLGRMKPAGMFLGFFTFGSFDPKLINLGTDTMTDVVTNMSQEMHFATSAELAAAGLTRNNIAYCVAQPTPSAFLASVVAGLKLPLE